jgi:hypothetical protein
VQCIPAAEIQLILFYGHEKKIMCCRNTNVKTDKRRCSNIISIDKKNGVHIYIYMWTLLELGMFCFFNKMMGFSTTRPDGHINMDASGIYLIQNDCGIESLY